MVETGEGAARGSLFMPVRVEIRDQKRSDSDLVGWIGTKRMELGLSQAELAKRVGVSKASVNCWESRIQSPRRGNLARLEEVLGAAGYAFEGPPA